MGSFFSVVNDTDNVMWIAYGPNRAAIDITIKVVKGIAAVAAAIPIYGRAIGIFTGARHIERAFAHTAQAATALSFMAGRMHNALPSTGTRSFGPTTPQIEAQLGQTGMRRVGPGETFTSRRLSLSLIQQADVVVLRNDNDGLTVTVGHFTVWSGATHQSNQTYRLSDHISSLDDRRVIKIRDMSRRFAIEKNPGGN